MLRRLLLTGVLLAIAGTAPFAQAVAQTTPQTTPQTTRRLRGTVDSVNGATLAMTTRDGDAATVTLAPNTTVAAMIPATLADVKRGAYVGVTSVGPKDKLRAVAVAIFPESARGAGEGHRPWDLMPESTMTNAAIDAESAGTDGQTLTLLASGERLQVLVGPDTAIVTTEPGTQAQLVPGAKILINAQQAADGSLSTNRVTVGKDGLTPPM